MAKINVLDNYPQVAILTVAGLAAASGTVITQLQTGLTNLQKVAWVAKRIEYHFTGAWMSALVNDEHYITLAITQSLNTAQVPNSSNPSIVDMLTLTGRGVATSVGITEILFQPIEHAGLDKLILPQTLALMLDWDSGAITVADAFVRLWYQEVELGPEDWYDLLQLRLPLGAS